jgi:CRISPR-associated protein Cmr4
MYKTAKPLFLIAETPVHAGSGNDLGYIDNPIQREVHTGYPKIEGSTLKGALRQNFEAKAEKDVQKWISINKVFGYDEDLPKSVKNDVEKSFGEKKDFAGAISFSDARILLFPVKSLKGTFAWVTCPRVLAKFRKELVDICGINNPFQEIILENDKPIITSNSALFIEENTIQLDEYIYNNVDKGVNDKSPIDKLAQWLKTNIFPNNGLAIGDIEKQFVVLPDDDFADFVRFGTEVATRIKIDNATGTVKEGALFTVEYLPSETVMYSLVMFAREFREGGLNEKEVENFFYNNKPDYFQLGGDATLGKGIFFLNSKNGGENGQQ